MPSRKSTKYFATACAAMGLAACGQSAQVSSPVNSGSVGTTINSPAPAIPVPRIIQETLFRQHDFYGIRGTAFNPTDRGMKNVVIKYYLFKSHMGKPNEGILVQTTGGLVEAQLRYLPPKIPVEFTAYSENAPTGGRTPEIEPEITAEWD
jgi:hypothetical protein